MTWIQDGGAQGRVIGSLPDRKLQKRGKKEALAVLYVSTEPTCLLAAESPSPLAEWLDEQVPLSSTRLDEGWTCSFPVCADGGACVIWDGGPSEDELSSGRSSWKGSQGSRLAQGTLSRPLWRDRAPGCWRLHEARQVENVGIRISSGAEVSLCVNVEVGSVGDTTERLLQRFLVPKLVWKEGVWLSLPDISGCLTRLLTVWD